MQFFDPKYFDDKKEPEKKRALVNFILDDGSETMRALLNDRQLPQLGFTEEEVFSLEHFNKRKAELLGEEMLFAGSFKTNTYFNKIEMNIERIDALDVQKLIQELE